MTMYLMIGMMQWFAIIVVSTLACVTYGIIHDQVTARVCVEYFTIGHPQALIIPSNDPTILGLVWGILATWWVGVILGVPLATVSRIGSRPKKAVRSLIGPMAVLFGSNAVVAILAGFVGFIAARNGWVWLDGEIAANVPREKHIPFLIDLWAHNGSYLGGLVGGVLLMSWVWRSRGRAQSLTKHNL